MPFIETKITPETIAKYDMQQDYAIVEKYYIKHMYSYGQELDLGTIKYYCSNLELRDFSKLIVNEEQDCYLRYAGNNMLAKVSYVHNYYLIYYKGQRMYFVTKTQMLEEDEANMFVSYETTILQINSLQPINITRELCDTIAASIRSEQSYREWSNWNFSITFKFNPIL